jgi:ssDNA-binding Zn-finger/Zn-ribbon topoisomerase 1
MVRHPKDKVKGRPIVCRECGKGGGTMIRVKERKDKAEYEHQRCP